MEKKWTENYSLGMSGFLSRRGVSNKYKKTMSIGKEIKKNKDAINKTVTVKKNTLNLTKRMMKKINYKTNNSHKL